MYIYTNLCENFSCAMCGQCCKNDWLVTLDKNSYERNQKNFAQAGKESEFKQIFIPLEKQKASLGEYAYISKKEQGGCWFLGKNNLCHLQCENGHNALDTVCQTFPRYPMSTARGIELTLSFSCTKVLDIASTTPALHVIRNEKPPFSLNPNNYVVEIHPKQNSPFQVLHYYFELEQHFMDILQWQKVTLKDRLLLLQKTVKAITPLNGNEQLGSELTRLIYCNYDKMDAVASATPSSEQSPADTLTENFLVNFIFKKVFYIHGLEQAMTLLNQIGQKILAARANAGPQKSDLDATKQTIMTIALAYGHDRQALRKLL